MNVFYMLAYGFNTAVVHKTAQLIHTFSKE